jgi:hypothetical protein
MWRILIILIVISGTTMGAEPLRMVEPGKRAYSSVFVPKTLGPGIQVSHGKWSAAEGVLTGEEVEADNHSANIRVKSAVADTGVVEVKFRFGTAEQISVSLAGKGQGRVLVVSKKAFWMRIKAGKQGVARVWSLTKCELTDGWQTLRIEFTGKEFLATLNDTCQLYGADDTMLIPKTNLSIGVSGGTGDFASITVAPGSVADGWEKARPQLGEPMTLKTFNERLEKLGE